MKYITSKSNDTIKLIRGLKLRKIRKQSGRFYIEGIRQVGEALESGFPLELIIYSADLLTSEYGLQIIENGKNTGIEIIEVSANIFESFSDKDGPQGIAAVGIQHLEQLENIQMNGLWIALEEIQDPGNLGTILRSLDGAGGKGMILIGNTTDPYHPTAVRSSMGSIFYTPILSTSLVAFTSWKERHGIFCAGTVCESGIRYREQTYPEDMVLAMGSEQKGISPDLEKACDAVVTIPMTGKVDSLNLSIAASIVLFEIYARKR